jgi:hypothetical protein
VTRKIGDETIVVPVRSGVADLEAIYTFNDTGTLIWAGIGAGWRLGEIAKALADEFVVSEETALGDVRSFLGTLLEDHLVELIPEE